MNVSAKQHQDGIGAMADDGIGAALAATRRWRVEAGGIQVKVTLLDVLTERVLEGVVEGLTGEEVVDVLDGDAAGQGADRVHDGKASDVLCSLEGEATVST